MRVRMFGTDEEREVDDLTGNRLIARGEARRIRAGDPDPEPAKPARGARATKAPDAPPGTDAAEAVTETSAETVTKETPDA